MLCCVQVTWQSTLAVSAGGKCCTRINANKSRKKLRVLWLIWLSILVKLLASHLHQHCNCTYGCNSVLDCRNGKLLAACHAGDAGGIVGAVRRPCSPADEPIVITNPRPKPDLGWIVSGINQEMFSHTLSHPSHFIRTLPFYDMDKLPSRLKHHIENNFQLQGIMTPWSNLKRRIIIVRNEPCNDVIPFAPAEIHKSLGSLNKTPSAKVVRYTQCSTRPAFMWPRNTSMSKFVPQIRNLAMWFRFLSLLLSLLMTGWEQSLMYWRHWWSQWGFRWTWLTSETSRARWNSWRSCDQTSK